MPSSRWLPLLPLLLLLSGCDRAVQERAEQIRQLSDREDRAYGEQAISQIEHKYWTLRDHAWLGKLPDGIIVRLDSPHAVAAPLPSSAFYSGWHLQVTISSDDWRTYPPSSHQTPFEAVYAITRHSADSWDIRVTEGAFTAPLHREDVGRLQH